MSFKDRIVALCFDGLDAIRQNRGRFVAFLIFGILGICIGVWYGVAIAGEAMHFWHFLSRLLQVITGETSLIKYIFLLTVECALIVAIIIVLSLNYYLSFFSYLVFIYKGYIIAFNASIIIATAKLSCLPFVLLCYLPFSLIILFCLTCVALKASCDSFYGFTSRCPTNVGETLRSTKLLLLAIAVLCFLEAILTFLLTAGIVI